MRVLFITSAYPARVEDPRGTFIHDLARSLVAQGVAVTVLAPGAAGAPLHEVRDGVQIHRARYWVDRWQGLAVGLGGIVPNLRRTPWLLVQVPALVWALTRHALRLGQSADVIHAHWVYPAGIAGLLAARRHHKPLVLTSHGGDLNLAARFAPLRAVAGLIARRADTCLGVSHAAVTHFAKLGVPVQRTHLTPLGVQVPGIDGHGDVAPGSLLRFATASALRVVYVGSLIPRKSVETLIRAAQVTIAGGRKLVVAAVGTGPSLEKLSTMANGIQGHPVCFAGERPPDEVPEWISAADVLVLPSLSEGRPVAIMQAMAQGKAVIATDIPGNRDLVRHGESGFLFPPRDYAALARYMEQLIDTPRLLAAMGACGSREFERLDLSSGAAARRHVLQYQATMANFQVEGARH